MDKNRVVTFGSLGGQEVPADLDTSSVVGNGLVFKGCMSGYDNSSYLKYLYYGYAGGTKYTTGWCNVYIPVFNNGTHTYAFSYTGQHRNFFDLIMEAFAGNDKTNSTYDGVYKCTLSSISEMSDENIVNDVYLLEKYDSSIGEWVEALDENGDPIFYSERRTIENS